LVVLFFASVMLNGKVKLTVFFFLTVVWRPLVSVSALLVSCPAQLVAGLEGVIVNLPLLSLALNVPPPHLTDTPAPRFTLAALKPSPPPSANVNFFSFGALLPLLTVNLNTGFSFARPVSEVFVTVGLPTGQPVTVRVE